ncbi:LOW QUALITY PROTEIN: uncharacterized protein [Amphiura filiformis]|uniref:LOW QUALITY PROTEIN: uncharacterized protein n=1 Tax=Amphiura filiformis TaxID=82378 RepID=UPI003B226883
MLLSETKMAATNQESKNPDTVLVDLQNQLATARISVPELSTLSQKGDEKLVEKFLSESVEVQGNTEDVIQSQLYIAAFWGFHNVVKSLSEQGANVNHQNQGTLWTPLHAAAFQEHGKVVMLLLEKGAQPELPDAEGRTAKDFASASGKIWAHFAALNCPRTTKGELVDKGIIKKVTNQPRPNSKTRVSSAAGGIRMAAYSRPDSAYAIRPDPFVKKNKNPNDSSQMFAALGGDVLADEQGPVNNPSQSGQPAFSVWKN